ncbi:MAG: CHAT domain-containing protein, partial [Fimbriimonadales bacterium]|nr:CHAT domain-containing protein [Fimbriimonadales bacterium]
LGDTTRPEARAVLLRQHREWQSPEFIEARYPALSTEAPAVAQAWLPAAKGLIALADHLRQPALQGYTRLQFAYLLSILTEYAAALRQIEAAVSFFKRVGERVGQARALHLQAQIFDERGDHARALKLLQQAYALYQQANAERYLTSCEHSLAILHHQLGESERGLPYLQRALARAQRMGDSHRVARLLLFQGILYRALERYDDALQVYHQALPRFQAAGDTLNFARTLANIGLVYWSMGLLNEARLHYAQAMPHFREAGALGDVATCLLNTGILLQEEGDLVQAAQALTEARQLYEQIQDEEGVAFCLLNLASVFNTQKHAAQALAHAHDASLRFDRLGLAREAAFARFEKATALIDQGRFREADQTLARAQPALESAGAGEALVNCLFLRGECLRKQKRFQQAGNYYDRSLEQLMRLQRSSVPPEELSRYLVRFREIVSAVVCFYAGMGDARKAFTICQQGKGIALRQALWNRRRASSPLTPAEQKRLDELRLRWERAYAHWQQARQPAERRAKQREYERYLAEWQRYRQRLAARNARWQIQAGAPLPMERIPLDARTALVEYAISHEGLAILLLRRERGKLRLRSFVIRLTLEQLTETIAAFRRAIESEASLTQIHALGSRLYQWLLAPLEAHLQGISDLVLCPDGVLYQVPWGALRLPTGRYLTQRFTLTLAPSATVWATARQIAQGRQALHSRPLLVAVSRFAAGASGMMARAGLTPLPGVVQERQVLQRLFGKSLTTLSEGQARRERVLRALPRASLIHCATHAMVNLRMPLLSALA